MPTTRMKLEEREFQLSVSFLHLFFRTELNKNFLQDYNAVRRILRFSENFRRIGVNPT